MNGAVKTAAVLVTLALGTPCGVNGQELEIGIIDVYGLSRVSVRQVREMLTFTEGDNRIRSRRRTGVSEGIRGPPREVA